MIWHTKHKCGDWVLLLPDRVQWNVLLQMVMSKGQYILTRTKQYDSQWLSSITVIFFANHSALKKQISSIHYQHSRNKNITSVNTKKQCINTKKKIISVTYHTFEPHYLQWKWYCHLITTSKGSTQWTNYNHNNKVVFFVNIWQNSEHVMPIFLLHPKL